EARDPSRARQDDGWRRTNGVWKSRTRGRPLTWQEMFHMAATPAAELQSRFPDVRFDQGNGGLTRIVVDTDEAEAHVYLHGAHVTHYQPRGGRQQQSPVLMLSNRSHFQTGKPIRGGVPVIFPWFGPRK